MTAAAFVLLPLFLGCALKPGTGRPAGASEPVITYRVVSGWVGMKDELRVFSSGKTVHYYFHALSRKKTFRSSTVTADNLKTLLKTVDRLDFPALKSEYRGGVVYDAPVENLTVRKKDQTAHIVISPGADLPPLLTELRKLVSAIKTRVQESPGYDVIDCDSIIASPRTYQGRTIAVEAVFLYAPETGPRIVPRLTDTTASVAVVTDAPPVLLKTLDRRRVVAIGSVSDGRLEAKALEHLDG